VTRNEPEFAARPDKTIQGILRHADIGTTMNMHVKALPKFFTLCDESLGKGSGNATNTTDFLTGHLFTMGL